MKHIQVTGCIELEGEVTPFVSDEEAMFYSVYFGEPGNYEWVEDFVDRPSAMCFAYLTAERTGLPIDDRTWEADSELSDSVFDMLRGP